MATPIVESVFFDENTFMKFGEIFRNKKGKHQYQCILCAVILEKATDFEQHTSIHFNLILPPKLDDTIPTTTTTTPVEESPVLYFQWKPGSDECIPIGMEMLTEDELSLDNDDNDLEKPKKLEEMTACNKPSKSARSVAANLSDIATGKELKDERCLMKERRQHLSEDVYQCSFDPDPVSSCGKITDVDETVPVDELKQPLSPRTINEYEPIAFPLNIFNTDSEDIMQDVKFLALNSNAEDTVIPESVIDDKENDSFQTSTTSKKLPKKLKKDKTNNNTCEECGKRFTSASYYRVHKRIHSGERPHKCPHCKRAFLFNGVLVQHIKARHTKAPETNRVDETVDKAGNNKIIGSTCEECGKHFATAYYYKVHKRIHANERPHKCTHCKRAFLFRGLLVSHMKTRHNIVLPTNPASIKRGPPYICRICGSTLKDLYALNIHETAHSGDHRPYKCEKCPKTYLNKNHLKGHLLTHTNRIQYKCASCPKVFLGKTNLTYHQKTHAGLKKQCHICGMTVVSLNMHIRTHSGERPYKCTFCDKFFLTRSDRQTHERSHTGERPYPCDLCPKAFATSNLRKKHMRSHEGHETMRQCPLCDYTVKNSRDCLRVHVRMQHTGEKPFSCDQCDGVFVSQNSLRLHKIKHVSGRNFQCRYCDKDFTDNRYRRAHERRMHEGRDQVKMELTD